MRQLTIALLAILVAACSAQPRSARYFIAHKQEAARIVAACQTGEKRGPECETAEAGVLAAKQDAEIEFFKRSF